jgi:hypothetical protein
MYHVSEANLISDLDAIFNSVNMSHPVPIRDISVDWRTASSLIYFLDSYKLEMFSPDEVCTNWSTQFDLCFLNIQPVTAHFYASIISYCKAIWILM